MPPWRRRTRPQRHAAGRDNPVLAEDRPSSEDGDPRANGFLARSAARIAEHALGWAVGAALTAVAAVVIVMLGLGHRSPPDLDVNVRVTTAALFRSTPRSTFDSPERTEVSAKRGEQVIFLVRLRNLGDKAASTVITTLRHSVGLTVSPAVVCQGGDHPPKWCNHDRLRLLPTTAGFQTRKFERGRRVFALRARVESTAPTNAHLWATVAMDASNAKPVSDKVWVTVTA
ncbi:MAG: hypothetical protein V7607_1662 [Solirubrobacteraceae bacterium]